MKWSEVNYLYHNWDCTVLYDTPKEPGKIIRLSGTISCPKIGTLPVLNSPHGPRVASPPNYARVIIHNNTSEPAPYW